MHHWYITEAGVVTKLQPRRSGVPVSFPQTHRQVWGPPSPFTAYQGSFPAVKWPGCEADHTLPFSAEVKNKQIYTSTSPPCLYGVARDNFTFLDTLGNITEKITWSDTDKERIYTDKIINLPFFNNSKILSTASCYSLSENYIILWHPHVKCHLHKRLLTHL